LRPRKTFWRSRPGRSARSTASARSRWSGCGRSTPRCRRRLRGTTAHPLPSSGRRWKFDRRRPPRSQPFPRRPRSLDAARVRPRLREVTRKASRSLRLRSPARLAQTSPRRSPRCGEPSISAARAARPLRRHRPGLHLRARHLLPRRRNPPWCRHDKQSKPVVQQPGPQPRRVRYG
jgi:hypothetical protein